MVDGLWFQVQDTKTGEVTIRHLILFPVLIWKNDQKNFFTTENQENAREKKRTTTAGKTAIQGITANYFLVLQLCTCPFSPSSVVNSLNQNCASGAK
jgi:hypothetical protein